METPTGYSAGQSASMGPSNPSMHSRSSRHWPKGAAPSKPSCAPPGSSSCFPAGRSPFELGHEDAILSVAGEVLRKYRILTMQDRMNGAIEPPDLGLIHGLLSHTGSFTIRPIETESYSTWIDIGFSTCPRRSVKPADRSLIYDMIGNSWHGDF